MIWFRGKIQTSGENTYKDEQLSAIKKTQPGELVIMIVVFSKNRKNNSGS
ncbi:hypothetical protein TRIP_D440165 [uncultured Paludibacter sp.]|uniref:Uncharacterized protein n=1 Tax=uncultured Paludibacter sp. TaxID=497635 RepID=A0A653AJ96_9BACT|nr:hypothetical protein TRIP_D440165 [uncultured Paludibacter sp.]